MDDYLRRILTARVYDLAEETPLELAPKLSRRLGNRFWLKREDLQVAFSFKVRGAYNKMRELSAAALAHGVIAASAGNHAQGVALAARKLSCPALIVMPVTTPRIKVEAVRDLGAEVMLTGDSYAEAATVAQSLAETRQLIFIPPYDDPAVIAGQGTVGMEIVRQCPEPPDAVFVCVGGGGLIAGIAAYIKAVLPATAVIGVETYDADSLSQSLAAGQRITLPQVGLFADGTAVKCVGAEPFRLCQQYVDEVVRVDTDAICAAIKDVFEDTRCILEPSGALSIAGAKAHLQRVGWSGANVVAVASGANMNFDRLRHVAERAEIGEGREALFAATVPERPGSFRAFCIALGERNVTEFNYRFEGGTAARVFVGVEVADANGRRVLLDELSAAGYELLDLSTNETAKVHLRHLVGGRAPAAQNERIVRFEFPERPGALMRFLDALSPTWNLSLFHYRNHGTDVGRVLAGIQVPVGDAEKFKSFLADLEYPFVEVTDDRACKMFL